MPLHEDIIGTGDYLLPIDYLHLLVTFSALRGVTANELLEGSGILVEQLIQNPAHVRIDSFNQAIDNLIDLDSDPLLPFEFGLLLSKQSHGPLGLAGQSSGNLREYFEVLQSYIASRTGYTLEIPTRSQGAFFRISVVVTPPNASAAVIKFHVISNLVSIAWIVRMLTQGQSDKFEEVIQLVWPAPDIRVPDHLVPAGASLLFHQEDNLLQYKLAHMRTALKSRNTTTQKVALEQCDALMAFPPAGAGITEQIVWVFQRTYPELPTIRQVSHHLNISPATLKRRLNAVGTTFQELKNHERFSRVTRMLKCSNLPLSKIAHDSGYSDASNLVKAFRAYVGQTPAQYRNAHKGG
ncbi:MAG: helix-turn-helix domain-containing protein [Parasphingorhabdus sp.]